MGRQEKLKKLLFFLCLLLTIIYNIIYNLITKQKLKEVFIMIKIKEFHIRISLYYKGCREAFKLVLLKTTSLADARTIADALEEYYKADYSTTEII